MDLTQLRSIVEGVVADPETPAATRIRGAEVLLRLTAQLPADDQGEWAAIVREFGHD